MGQILFMCCNFYYEYCKANHTDIKSEFEYRKRYLNTDPIFKDLITTTHRYPTLVGLVWGLACCCWVICLPFGWIVVQKYTVRWADCCHPSSPVSAAASAWRDPDGGRHSQVRPVWSPARTIQRQQTALDTGGTSCIISVTAWKTWKS